jgi:hypothetical protein
LFRSDSLKLAAGQKEAKMVVRVEGNAAGGEHELVLRAKALRDGRWPVISETTVLVNLLKPQE